MLSGRLWRYGEIAEAGFLRSWRWRLCFLFVLEPYGLMIPGNRFLAIQIHRASFLLSPAGQRPGFRLLASTPAHRHKGRTTRSSTAPVPPKAEHHARFPQPWECAAPPPRMPRAECGSRHRTGRSIRSTVLDMRGHDTTSQVPWNAPTALPYTNTLDKEAQRLSAGHL